MQFFVGLQKILVHEYKTTYPTTSPFRPTLLGPDLFNALSGQIKTCKINRASSSLFRTGGVLGNRMENVKFMKRGRSRWR